MTAQPPLNPTPSHPTPLSPTRFHLQPLPSLALPTALNCSAQPSPPLHTHTHTHTHPPITLHSAPLEVVLAILNRDHCWVELHYGTRRSAMGLFLKSLETLSLISLLLRMLCLKLGQTSSPTLIGCVRESSIICWLLAMLVYF